MNEWRRPISANEFNAAVEEQISEQRREYADVDQAQRGNGVENHRLAGSNLQRQRRQQQYGATAHADGQKRQRMYRRSHPQHGRIEGVDQDRNDEPQIAAVERDRQQNFEAAAADDNNHAGERQQDAGALTQRQAIAKQHKRPHRNKQRRNRLQQQSIDRGGKMQAVISHRVVGREAGQCEQRQQSEMPPDQWPVARQVASGKRQQDDESAAPSDHRQRDRRDIGGDETAEHHISGPKQRRERQQQIRFME